MWALMLAFSVLMGLVIAMITFYFFGFRIFPVPFGSFISGLSVGLQSPAKPLKPTWLRLTLCTIAGGVGWSLLFMTYHH
jgi:hypothetical protein